MIRVENYFEKLILFDGVKLSSPLLNGDELRIIAQDFSVLPGHPLNKGEIEMILKEATLIFKGVTKSVRTIYEYEKNPKEEEFDSSYVIVDVLTSINEGEGISFGLEGVLTNPLAYVDWEIDADSFILEIP